MERDYKEGVRLVPRGPRVHWFGLNRQVPGQEDDDEDNNLHNERLG